MISKSSYNFKPTVHKLSYCFYYMIDLNQISPVADIGNFQSQIGENRNGSPASFTS